jgi:uncharacterized membrane protein
MTSKFARNWFVSFLVLFVVDVVWHRVIFNSFYVATMGDVVRVTSGALSPIIPFIAVADVGAALAYVSLVIPVARPKNQFLTYAAIAAIGIHGSFTIWNYALIPGWDASLTLFDLVYALVQGVIQGLLLRSLSGGPAATKDVQAAA